MNVNAKELRRHLSEYLTRAARGHSIDISMRGKPVARLTAIEPTSACEEDDLFGIWADRSDMDVALHIRDMRKGRSLP